MKHVLICGLSSVVCGLSAGCVTRSLTIKTEPPGALVYVNDQLKGHSPVTYDFEWYGWHRLTLRKQGYQRLDDRKELRSPGYLWIPFDLVMELLPFRISDARTWSYTLTPAPVLPTPMPPTEPGHPAEGGVGEGSPDTVGGRTELGYPPQVGERGSPAAAGGGTTDTKEPSNDSR